MHALWKIGNLVMVLLTTRFCSRTVPTQIMNERRLQYQQGINHFWDRLIHGCSAVFWMQTVEFLTHQLLQLDLQLEVSVFFTHHWCQQQVVSWLLAHAAVVIMLDRCWGPLIKWNYPSLEVTAIKSLSLPTSFSAPPSVVSFCRCLCFFFLKLCPEVTTSVTLSFSPGSPPSSGLADYPPSSPSGSGHLGGAQLINSPTVEGFLPVFRTSGPVLAQPAPEVKLW